MMFQVSKERISASIFSAAAILIQYWIMTNKETDILRYSPHYSPMYCIAR